MNKNKEPEVPDVPEVPHVIVRFMTPVSHLCYGGLSFNRFASSVLLASQSSTVIDVLSIVLVFPFMIVPLS